MQGRRPPQFPLAKPILLPSDWVAIEEKQKHLGLLSSDPPPKLLDQNPQALPGLPENARLNVRVQVRRLVVVVGVKLPACCGDPEKATHGWKKRERGREARRGEEKCIFTVRVRPNIQR